MRTISSPALAAVFVLWAGTASAECICLNRGVEIKEGKTACIKTASGGQLALCEKNLNVTNWKFLGEECPTAGVSITKDVALAVNPKPSGH
jgi:hypothetical protein